MRHPNVLCSSNKSRPDPMEQKGIYLQSCTCNPFALYVGQTRVNFKTRMSQHQSDTTSNKSDEHISGISKHARHCTAGQVDWEKPHILSTFQSKNKGALQQDLLIRESLEIRRLKTSTSNGLNDPQLCVRTNAWDPILQKISNH